MEIIFQDNKVLPNFKREVQINIDSSSNKRITKIIAFCKISLNILNNMLSIRQQIQLTTIIGLSKMRIIINLVAKEVQLFAKLKLIT